MASIVEQSDQHGVQAIGARSRCRLVAAAVLLVLVGAVAPANAAAASPETVTCGEAITHSIVIANDLGGCGFGNAVLTVGADHITIDLNGHTLSGTYGAALSSTGHSYVTIENGTLIDNAIALDLRENHHDTVRGVVAIGGGEGGGVFLSGGSQNSVVDSTVEGFDSDVPLTLSDESGDVIDGNQVLGVQGMLIGVGTGNQVSHNNAARIDVTGSGDLIEANTMTPGGVAFGPGLVIEGDDNRVVVNSVMDSISSSGQLQQFPEGIKVTGAGNLLSGNTSDNNAGDGIHVLDTGNTLTANVAYNNGAYGIEAISGVVDGGQNRADGNGKSPQCLNIDCSAPPPTSHGVTPTPPTVPPPPRITGHPAAVSTQLTVTFTFTDSQAGVRFECRLDGSAFTNCSSPRRYTGLRIGQHTFHVEALNSRAQASGAVSYTWTVKGTVKGILKGKYVITSGNVRAWARSAVVDQFYGARATARAARRS